MFHNVLLAEDDPEQIQTLLRFREKTGALEKKFQGWLIESLNYERSRLKGAWEASWPKV